MRQSDVAQRRAGRWRLLSLILAATAVLVLLASPFAKHPGRGALVLASEIDEVEQVIEEVGGVEEGEQGTIRVSETAEVHPV